jgi:uncharacterized protein YrrD
MEFKPDASVYKPDGQVLGHIDRVVLNPKTKAITGIIVRKGLFFPEDKVLPLSMIQSAEGDRVTLRSSAGDLESLPPFEEAHYVPLSEEESQAAAYAEGLASPLYWYPPMAGWLGHDYLPPFGMEIEQNIPDNTVAVRQGARVIGSDDHDIGHVDQVFTDEKSNRAAHILVAHGLLNKTHKLIPTTWIREMTEDEVRLNVGSGVVEALQEYPPYPPR